MPVLVGSLAGFAAQLGPRVKFTRRAARVVKYLRPGNSPARFPHDSSYPHFRSQLTSNIHLTFTNTRPVCRIAKMHLQLSTLSFIAVATGTFAAPALDTRSEAVSAMAAVPQWTIKSFTRNCNAADTSCTVSFGIDTQTAPVTSCSYTVTGAPASQASTSGITCGPYTISSGWSGQFGPGNGFTTWSLVDWSQHLIAWPAYSDRELVNGAAVTPDKSYSPQTLA